VRSNQRTWGKVLSLLGMLDVKRYGRQGQLLDDNDWANEVGRTANKGGRGGGAGPSFLTTPMPLERAVMMAHKKTILKLVEASEQHKLVYAALRACSGILD
jgi:hypothetical protein